MQQAREVVQDGGELDGGGVAGEEAQHAGLQLWHAAALKHFGGRLPHPALAHLAPRRVNIGML